MSATRCSVCVRLCEAVRYMSSLALHPSSGDIELSFVSFTIKFIVRVIVADATTLFFENRKVDSSFSF